MIIRLTYFFLLLIMLQILYKSGKRLSKHYDIFSKAGLMAIIIYTLNEGLRFGRGVDYNLYGIEYERYANTGGELTNHIGYAYLVKSLVAFNVPWQGCAMLMSFMFILGLLFLLKNYKETVPYALPFFVLVSSTTVENLMKWYLAFSFFMIGLSYQMAYKEGVHPKFIIFSSFGCLFHLAFIPVPFIFYFLSKFQKPLFSPFWAIFLFFLIGFTFQTSFMLRFVDIVNTLGNLAERFEHYGNNAEMWLVGGYSGRARPVFPGIMETIFICCLVVIGNICVKKTGHKYIFAYNLFLFGMLLKPISNQIELLARFDHVFFFFRAIVLSCVIQYVFIEKRVRVQPMLRALTMLIVFGWTLNILRQPLTGGTFKYLYVWNKQGNTYNTMIQIIQEEADKKSAKYE